MDKHSITPLQKWIPDLTSPLVIAGPCSAENEAQVMEVAYKLAKIPSVRVYRAGIWKPRTRPYTFEGMGEEALPWLQRVKKETGLMTTIEVANAKHVELALKYNVDIMWIGARTTVNPFSVQEIADVLKGTHVPVMVKNPINADLALWMGAIERMMGAGLTKIAAIHRGFSSAEKTMYRNLPMWRIPMELKRRMPDLPIICDPSHITGKRDMIAAVSQKALDVDMDGVMIETHPNPNKALSDAAQQVTPARLKEIVSSLLMKTEYSVDRHFESELDELRSHVDRIDLELLDALKNRMDTVKKIGKLKAENNITALQVHRMDQMLSNRVHMGVNRGLQEKYVREIYNVVHEESVRSQTKLMSEFKDNKDDK